MKRCLELASLGAGAVSPNPLVGAVIVHKGKIIGEGWHSRFGGPHAEVEAIASVKDVTLLPESTLYVNLEPCNHYGKTPPCSELIISKKIPHVVVGIRDPFPEVAGNGIARLKEAGVQVEEGVLTEECRWINRRFLTGVKLKRPYIILKWAQSNDGFIAPDAAQMSAQEFEEKRHITGFIVQKLVHRWRSEEDAILVGRATVATDDPALNNRAWTGRAPVRIIISGTGTLKESYKIFDQKQETLIFNAHTDKRENRVQWIKIDFTAAVPAQVARILYERNIRSVIVEGGRITLTHFIQENLWDEIQVFKTRAILGDGVQAPTFTGNCVSETILDGSLLSIYTNSHAV